MPSASAWSGLPLRATSGQQGMQRTHRTMEQNLTRLDQKNESMAGLWTYNQRAAELFGCKVALALGRAEHVSNRMGLPH